MALASRLRWGNLAAGAAVAILCGAILVSMARLGRTTPLLLFAGLGVPVGLALAFARAVRCRHCDIAADEGVLPLSAATAHAIKEAFVRTDTDQIARLLEVSAEPPYVVVRYAYCRGCRQAARLRWKGANPIEVDGPVASPVVAALDARRHMLRSGM